MDAVLPGDAPPAYADRRACRCWTACSKTLRLWPTAPAFSVAPFEDTVIGGRYRIHKDRRVAVVLTALHRDPAVGRSRALRHRPLPAENEARIHPHAYKPFGNGERACIGRQFALTEAKLALALMLRHFQLHDPHDYQFRIKETLTLKPDHFLLRARRRPHERIVAAPASRRHGAAARPVVAAGGETLAVLCASSLGTARELAEQVQRARWRPATRPRCTTSTTRSASCPRKGWR